MDRHPRELGIAFVEYCFQVPANRIGHYEFTATQLKTIQEVITLIVFCIFSVLYLKEELKWNYLVGFGLMIGAVFFVFKEWWRSRHLAAPPESDSHSPDTFAAKNVGQTKHNVLAA